MTSFDTAREADAATEPAPDGSTVRPLLELPGLGGMATFELPPAAVSAPVQHSTVAELWYVIEGAGELWRRQDATESTVPLRPGTCASIPVGTAFQFRTGGDGPLRIVAVTMPPWPGAAEARAAPGAWSYP
jgi:mannose-6-phosphate isomerase-like protein (cupin superfamily)